MAAYPEPKPFRFNERIHCLENERDWEKPNPAAVVFKGKRKEMSTRQRSGSPCLGEGQQENTA